MIVCSAGTGMYRPVARVHEVSDDHWYYMSHTVLYLRRAQSIIDDNDL
jgi:hypothetical protein